MSVKLVSQACLRGDIIEFDIIGQSKGVLGEQSSLLLPITLSGCVRIS